MKAGLTTSVLLHAALIGFGLFTLSAPRAYEVADVEALPVDIVPVESITQVQQGDKKARADDKPAPKPTEKPDVVPDAAKVGDNEIDTDKPPTPEAKPKPVETAALPTPSPEPAPKPADQPKPEPVRQPEPKPQSVPATEVTPEPQPKQEVKPDPAPETAVAEAPDAETVKLPDSAPSPEARPQPPKAQTARAPDHKDSEKPAVREAAKPKSDEKEFNADEVAALLNKEKSAGGGAKRSTKEASLGGDRTTSGEKLSQSEMDALRGQIQKCWNIPIGVENADELKVTVQFKLDRTGKLEGPPRLVDSAGNRQADESALRAVNICGQRGFNLPADKYEAWADVIVHFDPSEMF